MTIIKGTHIPSNTKGFGKRYSLVYLWCNKIENQGVRFGGKLIFGGNCVIEAVTKPCRVDGEKRQCTQTAHIYERPGQSPRWGGGRKR